MFRRSSLALLLFACGVFFACSSQKPDAEAAANAFFALLGKGDTRTAYDSTAFGFQAQQSLASFEVTVKDLGLDDFTNITWTRKVLLGNEASLNGEITTRDTRKVLVALTFIKESNAWKLYSLHTPGQDATLPSENKFSLVGKGASFDDGYHHPLPTDQEANKLVRDTLLKFDQAIRQKSFSDFYAYVSTAWQSQLSEKRLQRAFQPFIDNNIQLGGLKDLDPVFDEKPQISSDGLLVASGSFATTPHRAVFRVKYVYELPKWKLFGIDVDLVK